MLNQLKGFIFSLVFGAALFWAGIGLLVLALWIKIAL